MGRRRSGAIGCDRAAQGPVLVLSGSMSALSARQIDAARSYDHVRSMRWKPRGATRPMNRAVAEKIRACFAAEGTCLPTPELGDRRGEGRVDAPARCARLRPSVAPGARTHAGSTPRRRRRRYLELALQALAPPRWSGSSSGPASLSAGFTQRRLGSTAWRSCSRAARGAATPFREAADGASESGVPASNPDRTQLGECPSRQ